MENDIINVKAHIDEDLWPKNSSCSSFIVLSDRFLFLPGIQPKTMNKTNTAFICINNYR